VQRVLERLSEVPVEVRVDDGIQRGIRVADPEENGDEDVGRGTRVAQRCRQIPISGCECVVWVNWFLDFIIKYSLAYWKVSNINYHIKKGSQHAINVPVIEMTRKKERKKRRVKKLSKLIQHFQHFQHFQIHKIR
jgi:hypothetical protein